MTKFTWKITEITADQETITSAKYHCSCGDDPVVETEGYWYFNEPKAKVPFADVTEDMIVEWINSEAIRDGKNLITSRLEEQLEALTHKSVAVLPWLPQKFVPEI